MNIEKFNGVNSDFSLVELADDGNIGRLTPHCKKHRAMNKINEYLWRCISTYKMNDAGGFGGTNCYACCVEITKETKPSETKK